MRRERSIGAPAKPEAGTPHSLELYGRALEDYFAGEHGATLGLHSSLGEHDEIPVAVFFREGDELFPFEEAALALARGRVLDAGAGTGVHSLPLQGRGLDVTAVELVPEAVAIMRARGVRRAVQGDMFQLEAGRFDTVLMLMNGIGPVGTLEGLDRFLRRADRLLRPGGQILADSGEALPVAEAGSADEGADESASPEVPLPPVDESAYAGEAWIRLEYGGEIGTAFRELYVDQETFARRARAADWRFQPAFEEGMGSYLARLTREDG